jgi:hypothetical protein
MDEFWHGTGILMVFHRAARTTHLPLGPFILLGALAAIAI